MSFRDQGLTSAEIAPLWVTYVQNSALSCFYQHFIPHITDRLIKEMVKEALSLVEAYNKKIKTVFQEEKFPVPEAFSQKDVNNNAPALFTDLYALSFVYRAGQMTVPYYATVLTKVARTDIVDFFEDCIMHDKKLYKKSLNMMQEKGIYDRPPKMNYPKEVHYKQHESSVLKSLFGSNRPLNALELQELFFGIERNCIGLLLVNGLIQVTMDKEIKQYLLKGKNLAEKQIHAFNKILQDSDDLPTFPVTNEVTDSTESPFSERLILFFISATNQVAISTLGYSLSVTMRKDISIKYMEVISEILQYANEGMQLLINRGWMEELPQSIDKGEFYK
ncbi:MAG: DUF3231 family protein [Bacillus sp. (in: firmicutes)]